MRRSESSTKDVHGCKIAVAVSRRCSLCWVLNVGAVESRRLGCLKVLGDNASRKWGWSRFLMQIVGVAVWSGCRRSWRRSKMWTHMLLRLDDWCPGLCNPWLTESMSMWPRSAGASPNSVVARGLVLCRCLLLSDTGVCYLLELELELVCWCCCLVVQEQLQNEAGASPQVQVLVVAGTSAAPGSWCRCLLLGAAGTSLHLLGAFDAGANAVCLLQVWVAAVSSSRGVCKEV